MTTESIHTVIQAVGEALNHMTPDERATAIRGMDRIAGQAITHLAELPAGERNAVLADMQRELRHFAADITRTGPAELSRFARETAHWNRIAADAPGAPDPNAQRLIHDALDTAQRHNKAFRACRHVLAGGPVVGRSGALLCITHPAHGARCEDCHNTHVLTHNPIAERTCDDCGAVVEEIWPVYYIGPTAFRAVDLRGRRRYVPATLFVAGIGYCAHCKDARGGQFTTQADRENA